MLRSVELGLVALALPTRTGFDHIENLEERLRRASAVFTMAFEMGTRLVVVRAGGLPGESEADAARLAILRTTLGELARLADHRGIRLALETGADAGPALRGFLDAMGTPALAASVDPGALLAQGLDPVATARALGPWVAHAYATDSASTARLANPRGHGFPPGVLDWEEYLGALEEIAYTGYLTAWPEPDELARQLPPMIDRLRKF